MPVSTGYTIAELIHKGAATLVYRGQRTEDGARVVIKAPRGEFPTALDRARLRHEHALLRELAGPGIVAVHALETKGERAALVMEDVGLESLDRKLGAGLDVGLALRIAVELTVVLRRAHERRIVHKDVKPHNILVGTDPLRVYLIDWGIASRLGEAPEQGAGLSKAQGTLAYLSPEQTGMVDLPVGPRSDLYSLGVTLYEMLTGAVPFADASPTALVHSHLTRTPVPPHDLAPRIPVQLSNLVMKLLEKSAEDRYAGARGLELDLRECLSQWEQGGRIEPFPLGQWDKPGELRIPRRLYGREADIAALLKAFQRTRRGAAELVLVSGYPGIGKSAVIQAAGAQMKLRDARLATGKLEQFRDGAPYTSLIQALRALVRQVMTEPVEVVFDFRKKILEALGQNASVLTQMLPELERLLGLQPAVPALGPVETENRFHLVMQRFVSVFTSAERPLVLFLDDIQWADPASLKLLERLLTDPESRFLLVVGAYRDHDADRLQTLARTLDAIASGGGAVSRIVLRPLTPPEVGRLVADALRITPAEAEALGEALHRKTQGNPFFVVQLLGALVTDGLVAFDGEAQAWRWDLPAIAQSAVTDDLAELMAQKLRRLGAPTLGLLELAACLGAEFDHDTLARIAGASTSACARALWPALVESLIVPLHDDYRLLGDVEEDADAVAGLAGQVTYRFLHDRVQEAAYSLLDAGERPRVHLAIARLLRGRRTGEDTDDAVFTIAEHLNAARPLVTDHAERLEAAALDLRAGRRAMASVAYDAARAYLAAGIAVLPEDAWEAAYDLSLELRRAHAESVFLCGEFGEAAALFDDVLAHARSAARRAEVHLVRMQLYGTAYRFAESVRLGRDALAALGAPLPETEDACQAAIGVEVEALRSRLRGRTMEELLEAPPSTDARTALVTRLLLLLDTLSFAAGCPNLSALASLRQVTVALDSGPSELSAFGYATCAQMLLRMFGKSAEVDLMSRLAVALRERRPCPEIEARFSMTLAHADSMLRPAPEAIASYDRAAQIGLQYGDLTSFQHCTVIGLMLRMIAGDEELDALRARHEQAITMMQRARYEAATMILQANLQAIACLEGRTRLPSRFDDERFDEGAFLRRARDKGMELVLSCHWGVKLAVLAVHAEHEAAAPLLEEAAARMRCFGQSMQGHSAFFVCLHVLALLERSSGEEAARLQATLEAHHRALHARRALCDEAWRCQDTLIAAERARLLGQEMEAQRLFDQAITMAQRDGFARLFAMASEKLGSFAARRGLERLARAALSDAHHGFLRWGARIKAELLAAELPPQDALADRDSTPATTSRGTATVALQGILFDLGEALRTVRSISSEIVEERVIACFLRASAAYAPLTKARAILVRDGEATIAGAWSGGPDTLQTSSGGPIDAADIPESVVRFVARSHESVVLSDSDRTDLFAEDPYLREHRPKALLCLPLVHQGRLLGVWYAESEVTRELRRGSIEILQLLAGQAASALVNARLVADLEAASRELSEANLKLRVELEDRVRVERERSVLQERVISMQEEMLLELSNPLIPISDSVVVLPIIGTVGPRRAAHMVDSVLSGAHERGARALIIDVTGLREVDDAAVRALLELAGALRMLGVRVVLTGVRPDVAQTLVRLDVDMTGIVVRSTLQAGIAFAMNAR